MQRPEAWPRPHPGEGASAAQAGGAAPPTRATELRFQEPSLYTIKAVFILDNDGRRLLAKLELALCKGYGPFSFSFSQYYDDTFPSMKEQMVFEKNVFNKTSRAESEIAFFGGMTIVYKSSIDLLLYVVGSSSENELMLMSVLACLFDSLSHILRKNVEKRWLLENMDGAFLVLDEIVDGGVILESDPQQVIQKVNFRTDDAGLTEQSVAQVLQSAKEQIKWSLLK
ncbi:coatomer subunit zeta-2 isoform X1 [Alexandromys fortis]|uniref:coatomer subunit zeta-2 isoform X1 n=1 Tax=Alexandromys fortis TaxID=100897 RepID=UPI00215364F1|nr:coatomer subunit zeta-2 isoform X1 [Microtus fortis]